MAWTDLKAAVAEGVKTNGTQAITGALLQSTLSSIIDQVGANATFKGVATPATTPGTPDGPLFYIAYEKGIYANFNAINLTEEDGLVIILYSSNWNKINIPLASKDELVQVRSDLSENTVKLTELESEVSQLGQYLPSVKLELPTRQMGYATASGDPQKKVVISGVSNSEYLDISLQEFKGLRTFYLKTRRVDGTFRDVLLGYISGDYFNGFVVTATQDDYEGVITLPDGVTNVCINVRSGYDVVFIPVYADEIKSIKDAIKLNTIEQLETTTGYITASGSPERIIISNQSNSIHGMVDLKKVFSDKIYVTTKRLSSWLNDICIFADDDDLFLSPVTINTNYAVEQEITIPSGATKMYVNGYNGTSIFVRFPDDLPNEIFKLNQRVNDVNMIVGSDVESIPNKIPDSIIGNFSGIKSIRVYTPGLYSVKLTSFGYDTTTNKFYVSINNIVGVKDFPSKPTTGTQTMSFILDATSLYYVEVVIDWEQYNSGGAEYMSSISDIVVIKSNTNENIKNISGTIDLYTDKIIQLTDGMKLTGCGCKINVHSVNSCIVVGTNCEISNITFDDVTPNKIIREEYSAAEILEKPLREYIFKPIVSRSDLQNESANMFAGDNNYGLLRFKSSATNGRISGCTFNNFNRPVVCDSITRHKDTYHYVLDGNMFNSCRVGLSCLSEFSRIYGNYFFGCIYGIVIRASNFNSVNCNFVRCDCGVYFDSNQNAHGEISTFEFAHNGICGVYAKTINNGVGFIFTNCQFAQAPIIAESAYALKFSSCRMDSWVEIQSGAKNSIIGCNCGMDYVTDDGVSEIFNVPADTLLALNRAYLSTDNDANYNN